MKGPTLLTPVILSEARSALRALLAQSKDPVPARSANRPRREFPLRTLAALLLLSTLSFAAQTLTGTVKNSTTGKPAAGDDVVLLKLGQGMEEAGRTKADAKGHFSFTLDDTPSPHLVRVIHQDVTYHRMAPPGTTSVEVEVFDVAKKVEGIEVVADIMRVQAEQGSLEIVRIFGVDNTSGGVEGIVLMRRGENPARCGIDRAGNLAVVAKYVLLDFLRYDLIALAGKHIKHALRSQILRHRANDNRPA